MALFQYRARGIEGQLLTGQIEGDDSNAVATQLIQGGITPIEIKLVGQGTAWLQMLQESISGNKVDPSELVMFARQMYTIVKAGIPIIAALRGLEASMQQPLMKKVLLQMSEELEKGVELSAAMSQHPNVFNDLFVGIVSVGESSGRLEEAFSQLSDYLERDLETSKRIKSALRYPSFVITALVLGLVAINIWVIPAFADMFERFNADLPLATQILLGTSNLFLSYWPLMLLITIAVAILLTRYVGTEEGSYAWGKMKLGIPIVGDIINRGSMARYSRSFALMMQSGVPLPQALGLCTRVIDNPYLGRKIESIRTGIQQGESLLKTHTASGMFSPLVLQMIGVGEESGSVETLLHEVAEFYEREVDYDLKSLSDRIEPILIMIMAGFVLILALGIFLPMWSMYAIQS